MSTVHPRQQMSSSQYLPHDLIQEILSWVPVKDLMRFRCVSKSWNSIVFNLDLIKLHLERSSKNTDVLLTFEDYNDKSKVCVAPYSIHGLLENTSSTIDACHRFNLDYNVLSVCNGLVCLCDSYRGVEFQEYWVRFWNPATRAMSQDSPPLHINSFHYKFGWYSLLFGFGYDDSEENYKVVALVSNIQTQKMEIRVYNLGGTCWRSILTCPTISLQTEDGQFVNDTINWLAFPKLDSECEWKTVAVNELVIFSYDLKNEIFNYMSMPNGLTDVSSYSPRLEVLKGYLCLSHHHGRTHFVVWLMMEFRVEKSWTKLLNVSYEHLQSIGSLGFPSIPVILCMSEDDEVMLLASYRGAEFILYNKRGNKIDRYEDFNNSKFSFRSYDYVQSLVLPYRN